ncbi:MAG: hypothetical protein OHK0044_30010 [Burkholderiaceae bacterium]
MCTTYLDTRTRSHGAADVTQAKQLARIERRADRLAAGQAASKVNFGVAEVEQRASAAAADKILGPRRSTKAK